MKMGTNEVCIAVFTNGVSDPDYVHEPGASARDGRATRSNNSSAEQAQTTAAQPQQAVTEAQHVAERASSSVAEAKTALAVVDKQSRDTDKRMCALQETRTLPHR